MASTAERRSECGEETGGSRTDIFAKEGWSGDVAVVVRQVDCY